MQTLEKSLLWQRLRQMSEEGAPVEAIVDSVRPAGLIVRLEGSDITGFVPGSHILQVQCFPPSFPQCLMPYQEILIPNIYMNWACWEPCEGHWVV